MHCSLFRRLKYSIIRLATFDTTFNALNAVEKAGVVTQGGVQSRGPLALETLEAQGGASDDPEEVISNNLRGFQRKFALRSEELMRMQENLISSMKNAEQNVINTIGGSLAYRLINNPVSAGRSQTRTTFDSA